MSTMTEPQRFEAILEENGQVVSRVDTDSSRSDAEQAVQSGLTRARQTGSIHVIHRTTQAWEAVRTSGRTCRMRGYVRATPLHG